MQVEVEDLRLNYLMAEFAASWRFHLVMVLVSLVLLSLSFPIPAAEYLSDMERPTVAAA